MVMGWTAVFGLLVWRRHDRFASFGFDMGVLDQATWLLSRFGGQFITVRGLPVFGHHASVALYLLVPFYRLGAGPHFLNLLQVASAALGAVPVYLLARHRLRSGWVALPLAGAFLLHPSLQFMAWELFHPDTMAITPLLFAYWLAVRRRWGWFAVAAVLAVAWKEDVALAVAALGLLLALRGERRVGLVTALAAVGWFLFATRLLLPNVSGADPFYLTFFSQFGDSPTEIVKNVVSDPGEVAKHVASPEAGRYLWRLTAPFAFVPVLAPAALVIAVPQLLVNLLSAEDFTRTVTFHYAALPLTALILATVEGIGLYASRPSTRRVLTGLVVVTAFVATVLWGPSPLGVESGRYWPAAGDRRTAKEAAVALVPHDAAVSASYSFVPHLSHRYRIYEFPNPFATSNWGVRGENPPSPSDARWLIVDRRLAGAQFRPLLDELLASGEFRVVFDDDDVVVAERVSG